MSNKTTAIGHSNIAFIKYWGNRDAKLRIPLNDSISMNLDALTTTTTVAFDDALDQDIVQLDDQPADEKTAARVREHLTRVRALAHIETRARVASRNNFPAAAGLASSASAFAALSVAAARAAGLDLSERELSILARQGSGSAARSIPGGFVEWLAAKDVNYTSEQSYARTLMPPDAWALTDVIALVSPDAKKVGSTEGHAAAPSSPFLAERLARLPMRYHHVRRQTLAKNLTRLGPDLEAEAIELHMLAMTSQPPIFYWAPGTVRVLDAVRAWRAEGLEAYYTLDAGPNVHILVAQQDAAELARRVRALEGVQDVLTSGPGGAARVSEDHLF